MLKPNTPPPPQLDVSRKLLALRADASRVVAGGRVPLTRRADVLVSRRGRARHEPLLLAPTLTPLQARQVPAPHLLDVKAARH